MSSWPRNLGIPSAQDSVLSEGDHIGDVSGQVVKILGGVWNHGTQEEDGPVTRDTQLVPYFVQRRGEAVTALKLLQEIAATALDSIAGFVPPSVVI